MGYLKFTKSVSTFLIMDKQNINEFIISSIIIAMDYVLGHLIAGLNWEEDSLH